MNVRHIVLRFVAIPVLFCALGAAETAAITGAWCFNAEDSTDLAAWGRRIPHLDIRDDGETVTIVTEWRRGRRSWSDTLAVVPGGKPAKSIVYSPLWPQNWFMGVLAKTGGTRTATAAWLEPGRRLMAETRQTVEVSQGEAVIVTTYEYRLDPGGDRLTLTEQRSSRPTPVTLVFDRLAEGVVE